MTSTQNVCALSALPDSGDAARSTGQPGRGALWSTMADVCRLLRLETKTQYAGQETLFQHRRLKPGQRLYHAGQAFEALYLVNSGYLKTLIVDGEGNERVLSFPMKGDLLGSDGICKDCHASEVTALSDCDLIVIPFRQLVALGHACDEFEQVIYRVISRELVQEHINLATLGALQSDARVAHFIAMQAERHAALGFSPRAFLLRMTRREIGSYLGLTLETVSRSLSALHSAGVIRIDQRDVEILKPEALRAVRRAPAETPPQPKIHAVSSKRSQPVRLPKTRTATPWQALQAAA
ncbi:MAG: Crp/Fnr family transcriptional regulator [Burkholderiaceae bacterium]